MSVSTTPRRGASPLRALLSLLGVVLACVVAVLMLEGGASLFLFAGDLRSARLPHDNVREHTKFDTLLGWVNDRNITSPNEYGPGIGITTNGHGFRGTRLLSSAPAAGALRVACSGDSFTIGYGVDDEHTWCHHLESLLPASETMNMGQAAYGYDQAYLWFMRDGVPYAPQLQIVALNYVQFERALTNNFDGRFKPFLEMDGARLVTRGVPVPQQTVAALRGAYSMRVIGDLRFVQWLRRFGRFDAAERAAREVDARWALVDGFVGALAAHHADRKSNVLLVYLPVRRDLRPTSVDRRRARLAATAAAHGVPFLDLTGALRTMRADSVDHAFLGKAPAGAAPGIEGHYSNFGNAWVARELANYLTKDPQMALRLAGARRAR